MMLIVFFVDMKFIKLVRKQPFPYDGDLKRYSRITQHRRENSYTDNMRLTFPASARREGQERLL